VGRVRQGEVLVDERSRFIAGGTPEVFDLLSFEVVEGSLDLLGPGTVAVRESDETPALGELIELTTPVGGLQSLEVVAVYSGNPSAFTISMDVFEQFFSERLDNQVLVRFSAGTDFDVASQAVESAIQGFPSIQIQDQDAFRDEASGQIGGIVNLLYALLDPRVRYS